MDLSLIVENSNCLLEKKEPAIKMRLKIKYTEDICNFIQSDYGLRKNFT